MIRLTIVLTALGAVSCMCAQDAAPNRGLLERRYKDGEKLTYHMKGSNERWRYEIQASGVVKKDAEGRPIEEIGWSNLVSDGNAIPLPAASLEFRQILSLDAGRVPSVPNLATVNPMLIGPITDLLTFYADLWLSARTGKMVRAGDHHYQKVGNTASWADGNYVVLGEDSIDFDITLESVDQASQVVTLLVRHVPPANPGIKLPAAWMRDPVADTPNNWVEVSRRDGKFIAAVGKETFDVRMKVSLADGRILSGNIENPVTARERECSDAELTKCGEARPHPILRRIELTLER
jgi:hypothetical protein